MKHQKEKTNRSKQIIVFVVLLIILIILILLKVFFKTQWPDSVISIVGVVVSMVGIMVTLIQVSSAVDKTEAVRMEVQKNNDEIRAFQNFASYSSEIKIIESIIDALHTKEFKFIRWQLAQLKDFLVKQKVDPHVQERLEWKQKIDGLIMNFGIDIRNIITKTSNRAFVLDTDSIAKHLTDTSDLLSEISSKIESEKYGTTSNS